MSDALANLGALGFGVRIDQPGTRISDFQTSHHGVAGTSMPLCERFYLADAIFVATLEGCDEAPRSRQVALPAPSGAFCSLHPRGMVPDDR